MGNVISTFFISLYLQPIINVLSKSGYGCHIQEFNHYADYITIICIAGLNAIIVI